MIEGRERLERQRGAIGAWARLPAADSTAALLLAGAALLAVIAAGFVLPYALWRIHRVVYVFNPPVVTIGSNRFSALLLAAPIVCAFAAYLAGILCAARVEGRRALAAALLVSLTGVALMATLNPVGAHDVYHNVADARTLWLHGADPIRRPPLDYPADPFLRYVPFWQNASTGYGPLWYLLAGVGLPLTHAALWSNVLVQKLIVVGAFVALVPLAAATARELGLNPVVAAVVVGWNPLLLFETGANAHNESLMLLCALGAVLCCARVRRWPLAFVLLALAVAVKSTMALLFPAMLAYMLLSGAARRRRVIWSVMAGLAAGLALYTLPPFSPLDLYHALLWESSHVTCSPGALIVDAGRYLFGLDFDALVAGLKIVVYPILCGAIAEVVLRFVRRPSLLRMNAAIFWTLFLTTVLARWWFREWYPVWVLPFAALAHDRRALLIALAFTFGGMLMYVPNFWVPFGPAGGMLGDASTSLVAFAPAVALALVPQPLIDRWARSLSPDPAAVLAGQT